MERGTRSMYGDGCRNGVLGVGMGAGGKRVQQPQAGAQLSRVPACTSWGGCEGISGETGWDYALGGVSARRIGLGWG